MDEHFRLVAVQASLATRDSISSELKRRIVEGDEGSRTVSVRGKRGAPSDAVDDVAKRVLARNLRNEIPDVFMVGEEASETIHPQGGDIRARTDALDGTKNGLMGFPWWCVACSIERYSERKGAWRPLAGCVVCAAGPVLSWSASSVYVQDSSVEGDPAVPLDGLEPGLANRVASVTAPPARRKALRELPFHNILGEDDDGPWHTSLAGNPVGIALLCNDLGGVIEPCWVDLHDALFLIPFELLGGRVFNAQTMEPLDFRAYIADLDPDAMFPPYIACSNETLQAQLIASAKVDAATRQSDEDIEDDGFVTFSAR